MLLLGELVLFRRLRLHAERRLPTWLRLHPRHLLHYVEVSAELWRGQADSASARKVGQRAGSLITPESDLAKSTGASPEAPVLFLGASREGRQNPLTQAV